MASEGQGEKSSLLPILAVLLIAGVVGGLAFVMSGDGPEEGPVDDTPRSETSEVQEESSSPKAGDTRREVSRPRDPIALTVLNADGTPAQGAAVRVMQGKTLVRANRNVEQTLATDASGQLTVVVNEPFPWLSITVPDHCAHHVELASYREPTLSLQLVKGGTLEVKVLEDISEEGRPLPDIPVRLMATLVKENPPQTFYSEQVTQEEGTTNFTVVPPSSMTLVLDNPEFDLMRDQFSVAADENAIKVYRLSRRVSLTGIVVDKIDGKPVANAVVECAPNAPPMALRSFDAAGSQIVSAKSDADGKFTLENVPHGRLFFSATAEGFSPTPHGPIELKHKAPPPDLRIQLIRSARINGVVVDESGQPIQGATVLMDSVTSSIFNKGQPSKMAIDSRQVTKKDGQFEFKDVVPNVPWLVQVNHPDFIDGKSEALKLKNGEHRDNMRVMLERGGIMSGEVVNTNGEPVSGAVLTIFKRTDSPNIRKNTSTNSGDDGSFRFKNVPSGIYTVKAECDGYVTVERHSVRHTASGVQVQLQKAASVSGIVTDREDGSPITKFEVRYRPTGIPGARSTNKELFEDREGKFELQGVSPGTWDFEVRAKDYSHETIYSVFVAEGAQEQGMAITLAHGAYLEGHITDTNGGPIKSAVVELDPKDPFDQRDKDYHLLRTGADESGYYKIENLVPGEYDLIVVHNRYAQTRPIQVAIREGERNVYDCTLMEGAKVTVYVRDETGAPIEGARCLLRDTALPPPVSTPGKRVNLRKEPFRDISGTLQGHSGRNRTDQNGRTLFYRQPAGEFKLTIAAEGYKRFFKDVKLDWGQTYTENVTLESTEQ